MKKNFISGIIKIWVLSFAVTVVIAACGSKSDSADNKTETNQAAVVGSDTPVSEASMVTGSAVVSTELKWYDFEEGMEKAKKENKALLIDAYTDWCGWCKVMDKETYKDAKVIAKLNESFVAVKFNPELDKKYNVDGTLKNGEGLLLWLAQGNPGGFPTSYFVFNPSKNMERAMQPGYLPPTDFLKLLDMVLAKKG